MNLTIDRLDERTKRHERELQILREAQTRMVVQMQQIKWAVFGGVVVLLAQAVGITELIKGVLL